MLCIQNHGPYAAILCPDFRLQAVIRHGGGENPAALVDGERKRSVILCCNAAAAARGIELRLPTVRALARCPELTVDHASSAAEAIATHRLLSTALDWVPGVEETAPGMITLDLFTQPSHHHINSARETLAELYDSGLDVKIGIGSTPELAQIAARAARCGENCFSDGLFEPFFLDPSRRQEILSHLPLALADLSRELSEQLMLCGFDTLGSFARLPREAVAARFGREGTELWLHLNARLRRPLRFVQPEERFVVQHDFECAVEDHAQLDHFLQNSLVTLMQRVRHAGQSVSAIELSLFFDDGSRWEKRSTLPESTLDEELMQRFVFSILAGAGVRAACAGARLQIFPAPSHTGQRSLFGQGLRHQQRCEETVSRLRKLLGSERVGSPRHATDHRSNGLLLSPLQAVLGEADSLTTSSTPEIGPLFRRYPVPSPATVYWRDGRPQRVESSRVSGVIADCRGPWILDGSWWHGDRSWQRVEWDIELLSDGLFRLIQDGRHWCLEGYYD